MSIIEFIVSIPFLAVLTIACGAPVRGTALVSAVLTASLTLLAACRFSLSMEGRFQMESSHTILDVSWFPKVSLAFGVDGVSIVLMILTALVGLAAILNAPAEEKIISRSPKYYYISCLLIGAGAMGAFCTTDLFFLYAFHEMALALTLLMIGEGIKGLRIEWKTMIFASTGSLFFLVGLILLLISLGAKTLDISDLIALARDTETAISVGDQGGIYLVLLIGFWIFAGLFPFHYWFSFALTKTPTPITMLHAGVLRSFGIYGLLRLAEPILPHGSDEMRNLVLVLLLSNIIGIGTREFRRKNPDQILSQFSIMLTGFALLGIASGTRTGLIGTVLFLFAHGLAIALLFALSDKLRENSKTLKINEPDKSAPHFPGFPFLFIVAGLAAIGIPGSASFPSLLMIFFGSFETLSEVGRLTNTQFAAILSIVGFGIAIANLPRAYRVIFSGNPNSEKLELAGSKFIAVMLLLVPLIIVGFAPEFVIRFIRAATEGISLIGGH